MRIAVVIVNYRTTHLVRRALASLARGYDGMEVSVIVVDGFSDDGSLPILERMVREPAFRGFVELLPLPMNGGFGWANNQALLRLLQRSEAPDAIHLLNPDAELQRDAGTALAHRLASDAHIGAVGSQLLDEDGRPTASAFCFPTVRGEFARGAATRFINEIMRVDDGALPAREEAAQVDWVTGASVMFRASALRDVGLFDDAFFLYHEEVELMWRLKRGGWSVWHEPASKVLHEGGAATGISQKIRSKSYPPRPAYWYDSRRLLFAKLYGRRSAAIAAVGWVAGNCVSLLRRALGLRGGHVPVEREARSLLLSNLRGFSRHGGHPTKWSDAPGSPPTWKS